MDIQCSRCKETKDESQFGWKSSAKAERQGYCKECGKKYHREWYHRNHAKALEGSKRSDKNIFVRNGAFVKVYLESHPCIDCGERDIEVLDFDHVRGIKKENIAYMIRKYSLEMLKDEIGKCEVRCANCHRRKTARERGKPRLTLR